MRLPRLRRRERAAPEPPGPDGQVAHDLAWAARYERGRGRRAGARIPSRVAADPAAELADRLGLPLYDPRRGVPGDPPVRGHR